MKVSCNIADIQNVYGTKQTLQTKPFIIPTLDEDIAKTNSTSKTNNVKTVNIGSIKLPEYMLTKTEPTRSDEEILKDIEELAKEHARIALLSGNKFEFQSGDRFEELKFEFVSSVSPDREGILKSKSNEIYERIASEMYGMEDLEDKEKNKDLIDYLMEMLGVGKGKNNSETIINNIATRGNNIAISGDMYSNNNIIATRSDGYYTQVDIDRGGGKITSLTYDSYGKLQPNIAMKGDMYDKVSVQSGVVKNAEFYDESGNWIMLYNGNNNRTEQLFTKAETERLAEMTGVYNAAFDAVYGRHIEHNGTSIMEEVYNSTYDRLTSGII